MHLVEMPTTSSSDLETEYQTIQRQYRTAAAAAMTILSVGVFFYHIVEKLSWVDALYFCTVTLTTIGYGDIAPKTSAGKLFTVFYVLVGIGIIAFFANILIKNAAIKRELRRKKRREQHEHK